MAPNTPNLGPVPTLGLLYANPLNRYLINPRCCRVLKRDADGGRDALNAQHSRTPAQTRRQTGCLHRKDRSSSSCAFYWPKEPALNGKWKAPPLKALQADP